MKKALQWIGISISTVGLGALLMLGLPAMLFMLLFLGLDHEHAAMNDNAESALRETGLTAYTEHAPWHDLSIDGTLTAFIMPKYDNHVDNTNLRSGMMAHASTAEGWQTEPVTPAEYASLLPAEAAFLLPDVTFDARYQQEDTLAFFDQDSGLMVCLRTDAQPPSGSIRADKLTVPHNGYVYTMETHGGFHGDGTTFHALIVPEKQRAAFESTLSAHADWHKGTVTHAEYAVLQNTFYEHPGLLPSDEVNFDWWSHVDTYARNHPYEEPDFDVHPNYPAVMRKAGARWSYNWLVALYDADTGLFIFYQYDS